ncbi:MAG: cbb3-type cytochrome c oxidase subunit II, partial [Thermodesulfobacteriota bacterium]
MKMSLRVVVFGSVAILLSVIGIAVLLPTFTADRTPSEIYRSRSEMEARGRELYIANGCVYCHTQSVRTFDWGVGAERIAQAGDYIQDRPILLGSQRTGPDLSQEGGEHPDDWHIAHFTNPRYTSPNSIMPRFNFYSLEELKLLTAYVQSLGLKAADNRTRRQRVWKSKLIEAYEAGPDKNIEFLNAHIPQG